MIRGGFKFPKKRRNSKINGAANFFKKRKNRTADFSQKKE